MKSLWDAKDAADAVRHYARYAPQGVGEDLALRTYSARLLGRDPRLVLHGGGNTSVKTRARDVFGDDVEVLCVKGSGWDLATIEPAGHPAVRLLPLRRLRALDALSDEDMVNALRTNLLDAAAPNPSVETLLHAFIPDAFVDHTHSTALLTIADQPDAAAICADVYGERAPSIPYVAPGFALSKRAGDARDAHPNAHGLVLLQHGLFSFGPDARESYERMIALVSRAEDHVAARRSRRKPPNGAATGSRPSAADAARVLPVIRGALARGGARAKAPERWVLDLRSTEAARALSDDERAVDWAARGVITPDHVIRTKRVAFVTPATPATSSDAASAIRAWSDALDARMEAYVAAYRAYFERNDARAGGGKKALDPLPRVIVVPGLGLAGVGKNAADAAVHADVAELWAETLVAAEAIGRFEPVGEADTFDMEYWSLEQAKLGKGAERPLERRVVLVTGGAGAIGAATGKAFAAEGAEVALLDVDGAKVEAAARAIGRRAIGLACDVTQPSAVRAAFDAAVARFGGIDVVVSNAGNAPRGAMATLPDDVLRGSFELNFFGHQAVAQAALDVFRAQRMGGVLLFNVSKQAVNPGPDFGAYGTAKAALLALVRQYAIEHGTDGVRVNAINADRIRSGLLTGEMIQSRARARGVSEDEYMRGNLLGEEVTAADVAQAFVFAARMQKTTGAIFPVDGGNIAAAPR